MVSEEKRSGWLRITIMRGGNSDIEINKERSKPRKQVPDGDDEKDGMNPPKVQILLETNNEKKSPSSPAAKWFEGYEDEIVEHAKTEDWKTSKLMRMKMSYRYDQRTWLNEEELARMAEDVH